MSSRFWLSDYLLALLSLLCFAIALATVFAPNIAISLGQVNQLIVLSFPAASDGTLHPESFPILPAAIGMPLEPVVFTELRIDHPDELYGTQHYTVFARIYTAMPSTSSMSFSGVQKLYRWLDHIGQHRRCRILRYDWTSRNNEHRNEWYIIIF